MARCLSLVTVEIPLVPRIVQGGDPLIATFFFGFGPMNRNPRQLAGDCCRMMTIAALAGRCFLLAVLILGLTPLELKS